MDHRRPPARAARRQQKSPSRQHTDPQQGHTVKPQRSHSAVGAAIVAAAAMVAVFAFILTRGSSAPPPDDALRSGMDDAGAGPPVASAPVQGSGPSAAGNTTKADRKPPASSAPKAKATVPPSATPNTGPASPVFKRGQWIAVLEKYGTDGLDAEPLAKATAIKLINAGVPAKAMLVNGQYPGITNSSMESVTDTWMVYLGPGTSSAQMLNLCSDPRTQRVYSNSACPTYEPAGTS
ncbi:hypothetical protein ACIBL3_17905 [Kribbella sp. NPDC050124]|uniref:hypothetical protein n=1 Tax=Kribbella sp. NPDC050124 TaxID=3364114 RepID=UPI00378726CC